MKKIIAIIYLGLLLGCGCNKEGIPPITIENGAIIEKPYLWWNKEEEHDASVESYKLIYNSAFLAESHQGGKSYLTLIDIKNGQFLWKWNQYLNEIDRGLLEYYSYENLLVFQEGPRTYCINLESGNTQWTKIWDKQKYVKPCGFKGTLFLMDDYANEGEVYPSINFISMINGNLENRLTPLFKNIKNLNVFNELGNIHSVFSLISDSKQYLLITYSEAINYSKATPLISLYNNTDMTWVYEYKKITNLEQGGLGFVDVQNGKIYHDGASHVFCNDLWTGDSIWVQNFKGNFLFGSCLLDNGTIYCASEGDGYYALDAETGAIKWKGERAPGTSSRMVILNGVLYYINGGDGRLWALDAATGKTLWRLKSPDNNFGFKREINVMTGDGKRKGYVLTSTWHGACAYEAER